MKSFLTTLGMVLSCTLFSQTLQPTTFSTNSTVNSIARDGDTLYIAGGFSQVGLANSHLSIIPLGEDRPVADLLSANSTVQVSIPDGSGGWYIGGSFSTINGTSVLRVAHLNSDNTLDDAFSINLNSTVHSLSMDDDHLYIGGSFTVADGIDVGRIIRVNKVTGALDNGWLPSVNSTVNSIVLNADKVYIGGAFSQAEGSDDQRYFAIFSKITGDLLPSISFNSTIEVMVQDEDNIYLGGSFSSSGNFKSYIAAFLEDNDTPLSTFPDANSTVEVVIPDGDGGWYMGGSFSSVGGVAQNRLTHILEDGSIDPDFQVNANSTIHAIAIDGEDLYIGGSFNTINTINTTRVAKLNKTTGVLDATFTAQPNSTVLSLYINADELYLGGSFSEVSGQNKAQYFARLNKMTGEVLPSVSVNSTVHSITGNGEDVYMGGSYTQSGIQGRYLAKFSPDDAIPEWDFLDANSTVESIIPDGTGGWYISGSFSQLGGQTAPRIEHLLSDFSIDPNFALDVNSTTHALLIDGDFLYIGGSFSSVNGTPAPRLARVNKTTGVLDDTWLPSPNSTILAIQTDANHIYAGGSFNTIAGSNNTQYLAVFDKSTGDLLQTPSPNSTVHDFEENENGDILLSGSFTQIGYDNSYLAIFSEGEVIPQFESPSPNSTVETIIPDGSGGYYIAGSFSQVNSANMRISHILSDGSVDPAFAPTFNSTVHALYLDGSNLYCGGSFTNVNGASATRVARINASTGELDTDFTPSFNSTVLTIQGYEGNFYVGGSFTQANGQTRNYAAAVDLNGDLLAWNPNLNSTTHVIKSFNDNIFIGGSFTTVGGVSKTYLAALDPTTAALESFNAGALNNAVYSMVFSGSDLYIGGAFTSIAGNTRERVARLNAATGNLESLSIAVNSNVNSLAISGDVLAIGGSFTSVGGTPRTYLAEINRTNGALLPRNFGVNSTVNSVQYLNGNLIAGGSFSYIGLQSRSYIAEIDANVLTISDFNLGAVNSTVLKMNRNGSTLYIGGNFNQINGTSRLRAAAINLVDNSLTDFDPQLNSTVLDIQIDGNNCYLAGSFTTSSGVPRGSIASYNLSNNSLNDWSPNANSTVNTIGINGSDILLGGSFTYFQLQTHQYISRFLPASNTMESVVSGGANSTVLSLFLDNGDLHAGGFFTTIGGQTRQRYAKINTASGTVDPFTLNANNYVNTIARDGNRIYLGGVFTELDGQARLYAASYNADSETLTDWNPGFNSQVNSIAASGGQIRVGGSFTQSSTISRNYLSVFNKTSESINTEFNAQPNSTVLSLALDGDSLYAGGFFTAVAGVPRSRIASLDKLTGDLNTLNIEGVNNVVQAIQVQGDLLYLGGSFTTVNGEPRNYAATYNIATNSLSDLDPSFNNTVISLASDGTNLFYGGNFTLSKFKARNFFAAIDLASNEVLPLNPSFNSSVHSLLIEGNTMYAGGFFTTVNGLSRQRLCAFNKTTGSLNEFAPNVNNIIYAIEYANNTIYIGGSFSQVDGNTRNNLAALDASTGDITDFTFNTNSTVNTITISNNNLYVGGSFSTINGETRNRIAAIDLGGNTLLAYDPSSNGTIQTLKVSDNLLYAGGSFSNIGGQNRNRLASLSLANGSATGFSPNLNSTVNSIFIDQNYLFAGGSFTTLGGETVSRLVLLDKTTGENLFNFAPLLNSTVEAVHYQDETLVAGGSYTLIGNNYAHRYLSQFDVPPPGTSTFIVELESTTDYSGFDIDCNGSNTGEIAISISGGSGPYDYTLTNTTTSLVRTGQIASAAETATESNLPAGNYTITVEDNESGVANEGITLIQPSPFNAVLTTTQPVTTTGGSEAAISIALSGGTAPFDYSYIQDGEPSVGGTIPSNTPPTLIENLSAGSYVFSFTDANGCTTEATRQINDYVAVTLSFTIFDEITCQGELDGRIRIQASNGIPPYSYVLDASDDTYDRSGNLNFNGSSVIENDLGPGTYNVSITDATGAVTNAGPLELVDPALFEAEAEIIATVSTFGGNDGIIDLNISGGVAGYSFTFTRNGIFAGSGFSPTGTSNVNNLLAGEYVFTITDQNSCQLILPAIILTEVIDPCLELGGDSDDDGICDDNDPCPLLPNLENGDNCGINGTVENCACVEECNLVLGTPTVECTSNTPGVDEYTVSISYSGSAPGAVLSVENITGCDNVNILISGDNPSTNTNGTIVLTVSESEPCWGLSIESDLCSFELSGDSPSCASSAEGTALTCSDGIDNDGDGLIDCEDGDCLGLAPSNGCVTCFGDGLSFADEVIEYSNTCTSIVTDDPTQALGTPDIGVNGEGYVSLGNGFVSLAFTNNTLVNSGNEDPDLFVFEIGPAVEGSFIELRPLDQATEDILIAEGILDSDGDGFYEFGSIGGATASVDIDAFFTDLPGNSVLFDAIKITDDGTSCGGSTPGADIDGVCALSSLPCSIGATCDDGDPNTESDVFDSSCNCVGEPIFECPDLMANNGDSCQGDGTVVDCECLFPDCNGDLGGTVVDADNDGICDDIDNCLGTENPNQADLDEDGEGDLCDNDIDGDGFNNDNDCDPFDADITTPSTWYFDGDGDGFGTDDVLVQCDQPDGYASQPGDCDDSNPDINPSAQTLSFTGTGDFTNSIISPQTGAPTSTYNFSVVYTDATGGMPPVGFPRAIIDFENNGIFTNPNDRLVLLNPADVNDLNTTDGKVYVGSIIPLAAGTNYATRIQVQQNGCLTEIGPFNYPDVLVEPDLQIFANDISFDNFNPDINSPLEVSATFRNESDLPAEDFDVKLVNQYDPSIEYPIINIPYLGPNEETTVVWDIITPIEPAWCPMEVFVDVDDVVLETNEANNRAIRPFTNGDFNVPGAIEVTAGANPPSQAQNQFASVNVSGSAIYIDTAIELEDPGVAGATVTITNPLSGATFAGYTNSQGSFSVNVQVGNLPPGTYTLNGEITDFTLTGVFSVTFTIVPAVCLPDLTVSAISTPSQIFPGESISGTITVRNFGCAPITVPTRLDITQTDGTPLLEDVIVPPLAVGATFQVPFDDIVFNNLGTYAICGTADADSEVQEASEGNNTGCTYVTVVPPLPDINTSSGTTLNQFICSDPVFGSISTSNIGYVPTGPFDYTVEIFYEGVLQNTLTGSVANLNPGQNTAIGVNYAMTELGVYNFIARFDTPFPNGAVVELSEANNQGSYTRSIVPCKPDLVVLGCGQLEVDPQDLPIPGEATYTARVRNNGNAPATGPVFLDFEISNGETYSLEYGEDIAPGETVEFIQSAPSIAPAADLSEVLTAIVDPDNLIDEFQESNNEASNTLCWEFAPVPKCGSNFWTSSYAPNTAINLSVGLRAEHLYKASQVPVKFEVSGPGIVGTADLGNAVVNDVKENCGCPYVAVLPTTFFFPEVGVYTFTMTSDPENEYSECDEDNNILVVEVLVTTLPDMRILSQFINPTLLNPEPGENIFFDISYENISTSNVTDFMDLSVLIDEEPFEIAQDVPGLFQGTNNTITLTMPWSSDLAGAHIVRAIIDSGNEIAETNENNNEATRAVIVGSASNLFFEVFEPSNSSPLLNSPINIDAVIGNNGDLDVDADVIFSYLNTNGNPVQIGVLPVSVEAGGSQPLQIPWNVVLNNTTLTGEIVNASEVEFDYTDNFADANIGSFDVSIESIAFCEGENLGSLTASASGGTEPYTFSWNNGVVGPTIEGEPGIYTVTVTDGSGQETDASAAIIGDPTCVVPVCSMTAVSFNIDENCDPETGLYGASLTLAYANQPESGFINVNGEEFEITGSPQTFNFTFTEGPVSFNAAFTENTDCGLLLMTGVNLTACEQDCEGIFGGSATVDACGVCDDNPDNDNQTCLDCEGVPNGDALPGTPCFEGGSEGVYGDACDCIITSECSLSIISADVTDACDPNTGLYGVIVELAYANAPNEGDLLVNGTNYDITGSPQTINFSVASGPVIIDAAFTSDLSCNAMFDTGISVEACEEDCAGVFGGTSTIDECGVCDDNPDNDNETCLDCEGVPNGDAVTGTACFVGGLEGIWSSDCQCITDDPQPCSIEILGLTETTNGCFDSEPIVELALDIDNPNGETQLGILLDYTFNMDFEDENLIIEIPAEGGLITIPLTLASYGLTVDIFLSLGEGDTSCEASVAEAGYPIPVCLFPAVSILELECGGQVLQISNAVEGENPGGTATDETRTIYAFEPDAAGGVPTYTGSTWPYVIVEEGLIVDPNIEAIITVNDDGVLLVNGWPAYQFANDLDESDANGTFGPWNYFLLNGDLSQDACPDPCEGVVCGDTGDPCTEFVCENGDCVTVSLPDADEDGTCDAEDLCPNDPNKTEPGLCGCGEEDVDENENGICDSDEGGVDCDEWVVYLTDVPSGTVMTDIYKVTFDGTDANLDLIATSEIAVHFAYNEMDHLLYVVSSADGSYRTIDPHVEGAEFSAPTMIDADVNTITAVGFNLDGKMILGSSNADEIYCVNLADNSVSLFDGYAPVSGGDIAFDQEGTPYLATREGGGGLYIILDDEVGPDFLLGSVPSLVTGMTLGSTNQLLVSHRSASTLMVRNLDGSADAPYNLKLDGETFITFNGDMASGCADGRDEPEACVGFEVLEFNQGLRTNGQPVPADRSNPLLALGAPDASNTPGGFVSLGNGGSITIGFAGVILDGPGADLNIYETSFSGDVCGFGDDEEAEIELSQDGVNWVSAGIVCRDAQVDMTPLGIDFVSLIRITSVLGTSPDGYDVDGVEAVHGCGDNPLEICEDGNGGCYATSAEYVEGTTNPGGGALSPSRTILNNALGMPEGTDQMVFTTLGYGGSLTFEFNGLVPNGDGDDIEVVETSFNNPGCEAYPEFANVSVSLDGETFYYVGTVCKSDPYVDIADAVDSNGAPIALGCANYVRVANNDDMTSTPDGFDVDGIVALHNCDAAIDTNQRDNYMISAVASENVLSSFPNPTAGISQAVFITGTTTRTTLEVYDMNGRSVAALFNQIANAGQEYRVDFDGAGLPNGVYVYRLTTENETIIEKFIIAK